MPGRVLNIGIAQLVTPGAATTPSQTTVLPPALAVLAAGSVLQGKVAGRDPQGNLIIQLAQGSEVHLKSNLPLPTGSEVSLRFDQVQGQQAARIITVNGKPLAEWVQAQPPHLIPDDIIDLSSGQSKPTTPQSSAPPQAQTAQGEAKPSTPPPPLPPEITLRSNVQPGTILRGQLQPQIPVETPPQNVATPFREMANLVSRYTALPASTAASTPQAQGEAPLPLVSFRVLQIALPNGQVLNYDEAAAPPQENANPVNVIRNLATLFKTAMQSPQNPTPGPQPGISTPAAAPQTANPAGQAPVPSSPGAPAATTTAANPVPLAPPQPAAPGTPAPAATPTLTPSPGNPPPQGMPAPPPATPGPAASPTPAPAPMPTTAASTPATPSPMPSAPPPQTPPSFAPATQAAAELLEFIVPKPAGTNDAPVMLQSQKGTLVLEAPLHLPPGTRVTLLPLLTTAPQAEAPPPTPLPVGQGNLWAGLSALLGGKEHAATLPPAMQTVLDKLPQADAQLAVKMLPFLLAGQGKAEPLPEIAQMLRAAETQFPQAARAAQEMLQAAQMQAQTREAAPWQAFIVPVYDGQRVNEVRWYMKRKERPQYEEEDDTTRFIIELFLTQTGMLQLDGLFRVKEKSGKHFDLILRSHKAMPKEMEHEIARLFSQAMEETNMQGAVQFAVVPEFPVKPAEEIAASQSGSILA
ncbi:MAG: hypothetical protein J0L97_01195 [Alphaproteobacteria bacterium]|nr:hypothetical protein [Alphaproteobacteria bacterium]